MKQVVTLLVCLGLAGCMATGNGTTADPRPEPPPEPGAAAALLCEADPVQAYLGQRADAATGAAILRDSGARTLRWGPPGGAWTKDFRQDRVNVQYDAGMTIERITCG